MHTSSLALTGLLLLGCAGVQLSSDRLERSEATMLGATAQGAADVPEAARYLRLAREEDQEARALAARNDPRASLVLARAQADAELAIELAREPALQEEARRAAEALRDVRSRPAP